MLYVRCSRMTSQLLLRTPLGLILLFSTSCLTRHTSIVVPAAPSVPVASDIYKLRDYQGNVAAYNTAIDELLTTGATSDCPSAVCSRAKYYRDAIAQDFMANVDYAYGVYAGGLYAQKGAYSIAGDVVAAGLTTGSAVSLVMRTKTILAAIATGMAGVNLSVDKNLFAQQTFAALIIAMQARRDQARAALTNNLALNVLDYPLAAVQRDLLSYFFCAHCRAPFRRFKKKRRRHRILQSCRLKSHCGICIKESRQIRRRPAFRRLRHLVRRSRRHHLAAFVARAGADVDHPVAPATTRMSCSTTITVLPARPARPAGPCSFSTSAGCSPVVGSSRTYSVSPRCVRCSSVASLIRWASPPESSVAGWPSRSSRGRRPATLASDRAHVRLVGEELPGRVDRQPSTSAMFLSRYSISSVFAL